MRNLVDCLESILVDDPDINDLGALASASLDKWSDPTMRLPKFTQVGDVLEIDCKKCSYFRITGLDFLCYIGARKLKIINAPSVQIDHISSIKNMSIELVGDSHLYIEHCPSLTIENTTLKARFIKIGADNYKTFECKLFKSNIECDYIKFKGMTKLSMSGCTIKADAMIFSSIHLTGNFMTKLTKIDIGKFTSRSNRKTRDWDYEFQMFPSIDQDIMCMDLDIERILNIKSNNLDGLKKIAFSEMTYGLVFFKRGLCSLPLSNHSKTADCVGPWEVCISKNVENELPIGIQYH